jgi:hypothetical protein
MPNYHLNASRISINICVALWNMALTFAKNGFYLMNWGFSVTDLIALAGAGRGVIIWLTADRRDSSLLSLLNVDEADLNLRLGLLDLSALNKRWGKELVLF